MDKLKKNIAKQLFDASDYGIILLDSDSKIILWNAWVSSASGISSDDALGSTLGGVFPGVLTDRFHQVVSDALNKGMSALLSRALNKELGAVPDN